jgi:hypothetical protein
MQRIRGRDEGSLVVALLASIIVGGLVITLVGTTMTGQSKVRDNRDFQLAINGADAGVNQALTEISRSDNLDVGTILTSESLAEESTRVGDVSFEWSAQRDTIISWRIFATGMRNGVERHVEVLAVRDPMFFMAAFADIGFAMKGGNVVTSYSKIDNDTDSGNGAVGSNGEVKSIGGGSSEADLIMLMGPGASCDGNVCDETPIVGFSNAFDLSAIADTIQEAIDASCGTDAMSSYTANYPLQGGQTYCFTSITVPSSGIPLNGHSAENPVVILMTGQFSTSNGSLVNCPAGGCKVADFPDARSLQIYSLGTKVAFGNQTEIAGAFAAPLATCVGNPSAAQADIYGALICNDLGNQGGWDFFFDDRLLDLGSGEYAIVEWREEVGGTTSFPD